MTLLFFTKLKFKPTEKNKITFHLNIEQHNNRVIPFKPTKVSTADKIETTKGTGEEHG